MRRIKVTAAGDSQVSELDINLNLKCIKTVPHAIILTKTSYSELILSWYLLVGSKSYRFETIHFWAWLSAVSSRSKEVDSRSEFILAATCAPFWWFHKEKQESTSKVFSWLLMAPSNMSMLYFVAIKQPLSNAGLEMSEHRIRVSALHCDTFSDWRLLRGFSQIALWFI